MITTIVKLKRPIRDFLHRLFCKHDWISKCYNIKSFDYGDRYELITIGFKYCNKCASSKLNFIFGNE